MPRLALVPRSAIPGAVLVLLLAVFGEAAAASPLPSLLRAPDGPSRMRLGSPSSTWRLPDFFWDGALTSATLVCWTRFEAPRAGGAFRPDLLLFASHTAVAARSTVEGGGRLPAFLDLDDVPLSAAGTWGRANCVPQDAPIAPYAGGTFVVCVNLTADSAVTLTVGGAEWTTSGPTNAAIRNIAVAPGDASVALSAADPGAAVSLALAINPWIEFYGGIRVTGLGADGGVLPVSAGITNCWVMACLRMAASPQGLRTRADMISRWGGRDEYEATVAEVAGTPARDSRVLLNLATLYGVTTLDGRPRRIEAWGWKAFPRCLTEAEMWRVWELDIAELRRRGLDTALWEDGDEPLD